MIITKPKDILVPTDFSETASHALRYASGLAQTLGARLTVVYSDRFMPPIDYTATVGAWDESSFAQMKARAEEQLQRDAETNIDPSVPYDTVVRVAAPLDGITDQARESGAGLIVMGTHGRSGLRRVIIGSVTEAVMRRAEVPVIAVPLRSATTPLITTIVCPVIYNAQCLDALTFATAIASVDARFILIRSTPADDVIQAADDLAELRAWVPKAIANRCELKMFGNEHVADKIEAFAKSVYADLIVAGEPDDRTAADALHGTFAERLVQHSDCPVLTVNAAAAFVASRAAQHEERPDLVGAYR